jgi:hypothetical protein
LIAFSSAAISTPSRIMPNRVGRSQPFYGITNFLGMYRAIAHPAHNRRQCVAVVVIVIDQEDFLVIVLPLLLTV